MYFKTEEIALGEASEEEKVLLARILREEYGLEPVLAEIEIFLEKTASSRVYRCGLGKGRFLVIKKSFWMDAANEDALQKAKLALEKVYEVSEALRLKGVPLPKAYLNKKNEFTTTVGLNRFVVLEYVPGSHFSSRDGEFASGGKALGIFHREGMNFLKERPDEQDEIQKKIPVEKPYEETRILYNKLLRADFLREHACDEKDICEYVRDNIEILDSTIKFIDNSGVVDAGANKLSRGLVHNDFNINNALFHSDGASTLAIFLDVDQLGVAPHIWDVGNTLTSYASNFVGSANEKDFPKHAAEFLRAYHKEFPLPEKEYELILAATQRWDMMRILRSLWRHHHDNNRLPGLLPKIKERLIPRIKDAPRVLAFITPDWIKETLS